MTSLTGNMGFRGPSGENVGRSLMSGGGQFGTQLPKGFKGGQLQQFTPEQMQLFQQMFGMVGPESYLSRLAGGDESLFEEMEAPAMRQFNELQGNLGSRFSNLGMGSRRSSGFQNQATAAQSNFAQDLQSQRQNLQRQAIMDLRGLSESLLNQRPYDQFAVRNQPKGSSGFGGVIGAGLGGLAGFLSPMPGGLLAGANLGYGIGSAF